MNQTQTVDAGAKSALENVWILLSLLLLGAALGGFYYFQDQYGALIRVAALMAALAASAAVFYQSQTGKSAWSYVLGSRIELRKVVWPTRQESVQTTLMIAVVVVIMSLVLWGLDSLLLAIVEWLTDRSKA